MPPPNPGTPRFLIGSGERLTAQAKFVSSPKPSKQAAYTVPDAAARLAPRVAKTVRSINALPPEARPNGEATALVTLHPEFLAKTLFPATLFAGVGIRAVGSRARRITPEKWSPTHKGSASETETIELYVAGTPENFEKWSRGLEMGSDYARGFDELPRIEDVRPIESLDETSRIRLPDQSGGTLLLEAAVHVPDEGGEDVLAGFKNFAATVGAKIIQEVGIVVPGLAFVPVQVARENVAKLAQFSFLRSLRPVVKLRPLPAPTFDAFVGGTV